VTRGAAAIALGLGLAGAVLGTGCEIAPPPVGGSAVAAGAAGAAGTPAAVPAAGVFPRHTGAAVVLPAGTRPPLPGGGGPLLDASAVLTLAEVVDATGTHDALVAARLAGIPQSASYDSLHFRPAAGPGHGVAVQVWRFAGAEAARAAYARDLARYVGAVTTNDLGDAAFHAYRSDIQYVHFLVASAPAVISVTCGVGVCSPDPARPPGGTALESLRWDGLVALARKAAARIPPAPPAPPPP
jgi:hypothetical protein